MFKNYVIKHSYIIKSIPKALATTVAIVIISFAQKDAGLFMTVKFLNQLIINR